MTAPRSKPPSLPRLAASAVVACGALAVVGLASRVGRGEGGPAPSVYSRAAGGPHPGAASSAAESADPAADAAQAERILASSLARIGQAKSLSIRLRQRVRIGDRVLVGAGRYLQAGRGDEQRFRFETTLKSDSESFEVTEVCDGLFCWLHRRTGPDRPVLERIDVQRVRARLEELKAADPSDTAPHVGGLQRSLWSMRQWFRFTAAVPAEIEGRPVWILEGHWQPGVLAILLPALAESTEKPGGIRPEELPDGVPWLVRLAVGQGDLLPVQLEFQAIPGTRPVSAAPPEPIAVVDFLEVEIDRPVDATAFFYQPASEELVDLTGHVVKTMSLMRP